MSGLINSLHIGKTSLATSQKAIEVTGSNISNVNTPGYSRQTPVLSGYPALNVNGVFVGQGVRIDDVSRQHDAFINRQIEDKSASLGEENAKATPLAELEQVVNISENSLAAELGRFFDAWQELSADPASAVARDAVVRRGETLGQAFQSTAGELQAVKEGINVTLEAKIAEVNPRLQELADLNERINSIEITGQTALADRDRRDVLLTEISTSLGVSHFEAEDGMVSVMSPGGLPLVQGVEAMTIEGVRVGGDVQLRLRIEDGAVDLGLGNIGGEFKGLMDVRDELLPQLQGDLDKLAYNLATEINAQHRLGVGLDAVGGRDFFAQPAAEPGAAATLTVALTDGNQVAAGATAAPGDNTNVLQIAALGQAPVIGGSETFTDFYAGMAARVGAEVSHNRLSAAGTQDTLTQLQNRRDSIAGVSLEDEMVNLIKFQKGFEASAKYLSTVDEMMDSLLSIKR